MQLVFLVSLGLVAVCSAASLTIPTDQIEAEVNSVIREKRQFGESENLHSRGVKDAFVDDFMILCF